MPRLPRIDFPGLYHHVIARGIQRGRIFRNDSDRAEFVNRLGRILGETKTICYAWALMPNHIHLLLQTGATSIAKTMQRLLTGYAVSFNLRYKRAGHLFQNRYKDIICQEDPYFMELLQYIPLNPVRGGIIWTPDELAVYPWTSHSAMMGKIRRPWQMVSSVLERFSSDLAQARQMYQAYLVEAWNRKKQDRLEGGGLIRSSGGVSEGRQAIREGDIHAYDQRILGDDAFVVETLRQGEQLENDQQEMKSVTIKMMLTLVADLTGQDAQRLTEKGQHRATTAAKAMAVYAGVAWLGKSTVSMGRQLGLSQSGASRAFTRGRALAEEFQLGERLKTQSFMNVP